jgi:hypothetical protein
MAIDISAVPPALGIIDKEKPNNIYGKQILVAASPSGPT